MECQRQSVLARVTGTVPEVVMALTVAIYYLVVAKTIFRPHLETLVTQRHDGPEQQQECSLLQASGQMRIISTVDISTMAPNLSKALKA